MFRSHEGRVRAAAFGLAASLLVTIAASGQTTRGTDPTELAGNQFLPALSITEPPLIEVSAKVDRFLKQRIQTRSRESVDILATLANPLTAVRMSALKNAGASLKAPMNSGKLLALRIPSSAISRIARLSWVKSLSEDLVVRKLDEFTLRGSLADVAYQQFGVDGSGVAIAVLDSGIGTSPDLEGRLIAGKSFVENDASTDDMCGHGTHVAGVIAGSGAASTGKNMIRTFYGVARGARLVNVRVLDSEGKGTVSGIIRGIEWVIAHKDRLGIRVINLSLGHEVGESYTTDPLCQAVQRAWEAGVVVVAAAGNSGRMHATPIPGLENEGYGAAYGSITSPGNSPYCITVGATRDVDGIRENDVAASYSGKGPTRIDFVLKPDIIAPGNRVISLRVPGSAVDTQYFTTNAVPVSYYKNNSNLNETRYYFRLSGTSIAAPVVSGAAALLLQKDPSLTPDSIKARLMITANKFVDPLGVYDVCTYGAGYLNIAGALGSSVVATRPAVSPTLSRDDSGSVYIDASSVLWGSHVIWGMTGVTTLNYIWGDTALYGTADNVIWGSGVLWGSAVWTDNVVWGNDTLENLRAALLFGEY